MQPENLWLPSLASYIQESEVVPFLRPVAVLSFKLRERYTLSN